MIIKTWDKIVDEFTSINIDNAMKAAGIVEAKRIIYLFFSTHDIEYMDNPDKDSVLDDIIIGKAIIVNMCVSDGKNKQMSFGKNWDSISHYNSFSNTKNFTRIYYNTYICDVRVHNKDIRDIRNMEFMIKESYIQNHTNDFDIDRTFDDGYNYYSSDIRDDEKLNEAIHNNVFISSPNVIPPEFYNDSHMYQSTREVYDIMSLGYMLTYNGSDLIDYNTSAVVLHLHKWDTMVPEIRDKIYDIRNNDPSRIDMSLISDTLLYDTVSKNQISGAIYIIDTELGVNVCNTTKTSIPFRKYELDSSLRNSITSITDTLRYFVSNISKDHGPVRLLYSPLYQGDKIETIFKDYKPDNQPILKRKQNIDKGMSINNELSEMIRIYNEDSDYYDSNPGYEEDY